MPSPPAPPPARATAEDERWSAWMERAQGGDAECYARLLTELESRLKPYLRRLLGGGELVDECMQECLLAIHKARHTYDTARPFKPWAYALARFKAVDSIRRASTRRRHEQLDDDAARAAPCGAPARGLSLDTSSALAGLSEPYRQAVILTKLEGYTIGEAAGRAGVSPGAMRSRVYRGLQELRGRLERDLR